MKISQFISVCVMVVVAWLLCLPMFAQEPCANGTCRTPVRSVVYGTSEVVGTVVSAPVHYLQEVQPVRSVVQATAQGFACGVAQSKANRQAAMGSCCHVGGSFGGGSAEGVGFSTSSPEAAVAKCCYYNQRKLRESGVAYGYNRRLRAWGWFACNLYE